jgi:dienelactone hydrolase
MSNEQILPDGRYYTATEYLLARYDAISRQMGYRATTPGEHQRWQHELRTRLRQLTGIDTMRDSALEPRITERVRLDGYVRERVLIQTEPGVTMPVYVLIPADLGPDERRPAVIAPHGHSSGGKFSPAGRRDIPALADTIAVHNYDYGVQFVRQGWVAFCPDARGFGERREWPRQGDSDDLLLSSSCEVLNHMAMSLGQTVTGMWTWDLMRLADYVERRPECDARRLGCAGLSGGGLQTLWFAALDERVRCAVVSGYFYGYKDSLLKLCANCSCNYVPHLWEAADMGDIAALIAPRPLLIETGARDPLNGERGVTNVTEQLAITQQAYDLLGVPERLSHDVFAGEHMSQNWRRTIRQEVSAAPDSVQTADRLCQMPWKPCCAPYLTGWRDVIPPRTLVLSRQRLPGWNRRNSSSSWGL